MKLDRMTELFNSFTEEQKNILMKKGDDYANEDRMSNFKTVASILSIKPELVCLTLIAVKVARLGNLIKGNEPKNESIDDSIIDMANYSFLLKCCREESKEQENLPF